MTDKTTPSGVQDIAAVAWRCIKECASHEMPPVMCVKHQLEAEALAGIARLEGKVAPITHSLRATSVVAPIPNLETDRLTALLQWVKAERDAVIRNSDCYWQMQRVVAKVEAEITK